MLVGEPGPPSVDGTEVVESRAAVAVVEPFRVLPLTSTHVVALLPTFRATCGIFVRR